MPAKSNRFKGFKAHLGKKSQASASRSPAWARDSVSKDDTAEEEDAEDDHSADASLRQGHQASSADVAILSSPQTPTAPSRRQLGNLALGHDDPFHHSALQEKYEQLIASGWRPEEEQASAADDDDYNGLDSISRSDDEEHVVLQEYEALVHQRDARRLSLQSDDMDVEWNGFDDTARDVSMIDSLFPNSELEPAFFLEKDQAGPNVFQFPPKAKHASNQKLVRFEVDSSASEDSDAETEDFNHEEYLFGHKMLSALTGHSFDGVAHVDEGSDAGSVWDFEGPEMMIDEQNDSDDYSSEASDESEGYKSDDDITDDEEPVPVSRSATSLCSKESSPADVFATPTPKTASAPPEGSRATPKVKPRKGQTNAATPRGPKMGTFVVDPHRPILRVDGSGAQQRNTLIAPKIQSPADKMLWQRMSMSCRFRSNSRTSIQMNARELLSGEELPLSAAETPFAALHNAYTSLKTMPPPEAEAPLTDVLKRGDQTPTMAISPGVGDGPDHEFVAMSPFFDWDKVNEDQEDLRQESPEFAESGSRKRANTLPSPMTPSSVASTPAPSLSRRTTGNSDFSDELLSHLHRDSTLVNAFRNNQQYVRHHASKAVHPSSRANASEVNAMQSGRRKYANLSMTPLRKTRGGSLSKISKLDWAKNPAMDESMSSKAVSPLHKRPVSAGGSGITKRNRGSFYR